MANGADDQPKVSDHQQMLKYAEDLAIMYRAEKDQREKLTQANAQLQLYAKDLHTALNDVRAKNATLKKAYLDTIHRLALAAEYKDEDTGNHIVRISRYSALIAETMGIPPQEVENLLYAAPMHDVGKIGIPDHILLKPGKLTPEEFEIMKTHTIIGANILDNSESDVITMARSIALSHHEQWNGQGYPYGLAGDAIPFVGRIVCIADFFDAVTSKRPYKDPYPVDVTADLIRRERAERFAPDIVDTFFACFDGLLRIKKEVNAEYDENQPVKNFAWSERDLCTMRHHS